MINNNGSTNGTVPSYSFENHVFNSVSSYLKSRFGGKVIKLSIDGGFNFPNRDGTKGVGGEAGRDVGYKKLSFQKTVFCYFFCFISGPSLPSL